MTSSNSSTSIAIEYPFVRLGGQQLFLSDLARSMLKIDPSLKIYWFYEFGDPSSLDIDHIHFIQLKVPPWFSPRTNHPIFCSLFSFLRLICRQISIFRYSLVFSIDAFIVSTLYGSIASALARILLKSRIYWLVGGEPAVIEPLLFRFLPLFNVKSLIDGVVAWPAAFSQLSNKGFESSKFRVSHIGKVDTSVFHPYPSAKVQELRKSIGFTDSHTVIGWVGRLHRDMQCMNTLRLFRRLYHYDPIKYRLLLVGGFITDGPNDSLASSFKDEFFDYIHQHNLSDAIHFTDWVPRSRVVELVNCMDVVPLLEEDPHGGSILREAMACGKLVLTVDGPSHVQSSFISHQTTGILVDSANFMDNSFNTIITLDKSSQEARQIGLAACQYAKDSLSFDSLALSILL